MRLFILMFFLFIPFLSLLANELPSQQPVRIGVVENQYDHVEKLLKKYKINYGMIKYRDLEKKSLYDSFDVLFFPCGAEPPLTSSVNILSRGVHIEGVSLNDQYYKIDIEKTGSFLKDFISNGGSAYFSDFSYRYLQESIKPFSFYKDFPYVGLSGTMKALPQGELKSYILSPSLALSVTHEGWVIPSEIHGSEVLLTAESETPLGMKKSPIAALIKHDSGQVVYSSYHDENDTFGIMRYLILKTIYTRETNALSSYVKKWEQRIETTIVDRSLAGETARYYSMTVKNGRNDIYFRSDGGEWQIDLFDASGLLLYSFDGVDDDFHYGFKIRGDQQILVKIVPLSVEKFHVYSAITASGFRFFPYYLHALFGFIALILIGFYIRYLHIERFKGKTFTGGKI
ncbi:MAG TPA: hypothetical protein VF857_03250 [Spirochaetota bacterium]